MDEGSSNYIHQIVEDDLRSGRHTEVVARFPPEPNGRLHIGHVKAIWMDFGTPLKYGGRCHLRMDDTNPMKESEEYVREIQRDIHWLGYDWGAHLYHASDYFDQLYAWARHLVSAGLAYVDEQSDEQIKATRGTVETPGTPGPWRNRPAAESLDLLEKMARGEFPDGAMVLRAKIDLTHPNMKMRDPLMYRIRHTPHHRTGTRWSIYPLYDWAHGQSDAIEGITHSMCSLEFDVNRELYDWFLEHLPVPSRPHQYEWARLNLTHTVMSKRILLALVTDGHVDGWDDPRMPTIAGLRRRGYTAASLLSFVERLGVSKAASMAEPAMLENAVREDLNDKAPRRMAVLDPIEVVVESWPEAEVDELEAEDWPPESRPPGLGVRSGDVPKTGSRPLPFSRRLLIERDDFRITPEPGFKRLAPGRAVRLRHGYVIHHVAHEVDASGRVSRLRVRHDPATRGGTTPAEGKVWGTIHWVSADHAVPLEVRLFDQLFAVPEPGKDRDFHLDLAPDSRRVVAGHGEPSLATLPAGAHVQLERLGYFFAEPETWKAGHPVLNRVVPLKDTWARRDHVHPPVTAAPVTRAATMQAPIRSLGAVAKALVARGLSEDEAAVVEADPELGRWLDAALAVHAHPRSVASWLLSELRREANGRALADLPLRPEAVGRLAALVDSGSLTTPLARQVLAVLVAEGGTPDDVVRDRNLAPLTDDTAVRALVTEVLGAFPDKLAALRSGRTGLLGFFVGEVLKRSGGRVDPKTVRTLIEAEIG